LIREIKYNKHKLKELKKQHIKYLESIHYLLY